MELYLLIIYGVMGLWGVVSLFSIIRLYSSADVRTVNDYMYHAIPSVFTTLGVLGTFLGIYYGLQAFDTNNIDGSIAELLDGLKSAFITSIVGIIAALVFGRISEYVYGYAEDHTPVKAQASDELTALREISNFIQDSNQRQDERWKELHTALVGESSGSLATHFVKMRNQLQENQVQQAKTTEAIQGVQQALGQDVETNLLVQVQKLRAEQNEQATTTGQAVRSVMDTMNANSDLLRNKFDEFAELLAKNNTEALVDMMRNATETFNEQMSALVEKLVKENFEELNTSVQRMNDWQRENREMISTLTEQYRLVANQFALTAEAIQVITANTEKLTADNSVLQKIVQELRAVMVDDRRFTDITNKVAGTVELLKENTESFDKTTDKLNQWIQKEHSFRESVDALIIKLKEIEKIRDINGEFWDGTKKQLNEGVGILTGASKELREGLDDINQSYTDQLNLTLVSLDQLIQRMHQNAIRA